MQTEYSLCQRRAHDIQTDLRPIWSQSPRSAAVPAGAAIAKTFTAVFRHYTRVIMNGGRRRTQALMREVASAAVLVARLRLVFRIFRTARLRV
jgi:hypothetical protein